MLLLLSKLNEWMLHILFSIFSKNFDEVQIWLKTIIVSIG